MEDSNTIAWLSPEKSESDGRYTWEAIRMNISQNIPTVSDYRSRESTASLEDEKDNTADDTSYPRLHLAFNSGLKSGYGLMFGTDPNSCNIVLPKLRKISQRHCYLTFDAERRLILRDCSTHGTIVTYNDKGRELRHHFTWILGGHEVPRKTKKIVIEIQGVSFQIAVSTHDAHPDQYNANVDRFLLEADEPHFNGLGIQSTSSTAAPSGAHTPSQGPIRLKQETLGKGVFAVVRRYWDVSTGLEYAYKEPLDKRRFNRKLWEKEADIMGQISHDHVVKLIESTLTPSPRLILEYVPFGSLENQTNLSAEDCVTILYQGLSALVDLHGREEPIVHRDIKPANILVQSWDPLHVKFTDFGLSRASKDLTTYCGTPFYLAPEVYEKETYTPAVDIWSFGVLVFKLAYGLSNRHRYKGKRWCENIIEQVNDWDSEDLVDLLSTAMVVMEPKLRDSAKTCLDRTLKLSVPYRGRSITPTPASYAEGYNQTVVYPTEQHYIEYQANLPISSDDNLGYLSPDRRLAADCNCWSPQHEDSIPSGEIRRYVRSNAPTPNSHMSTSAETRKRSTRSSTSSSGRRRTKRHGKATAVSSSIRAQRGQSEPVIDLFGEGWLQDPNCVGSSVAAMGEDPSDWSSWGSLATEPSERYVPRSLPEPVDERNNDYDPHLLQGGDDFSQDAYLVDSVVQGGGEGAWIDSEGYMAARLLDAIREERI